MEQLRAIERQLARAMEALASVDPNDTMAMAMALGLVHILEQRLQAASKRVAESKAGRIDHVT